MSVVDGPTMKDHNHAWERKLSLRNKVLNNFTNKLRKLSPNRTVSLQLEDI